MRGIPENESQTESKIFHLSLKQNTMKDFFTKQNPRKASTKNVSAKLVFREPVTPYMMLGACKIVGMNFDDFLAHPQESLDGVTLTVPTAAEFMALVLKRPPKIKKMPHDVALAIANYALVDFFLSAFTGHVSGQLSTSALSGLVLGSEQLRSVYAELSREM